MDNVRRAGAGGHTYISHMIMTAAAAGQSQVSLGRRQKHQKQTQTRSRMALLFLAAAVTTAGIATEAEDGEYGTVFLS